MGVCAVLHFNPRRAGTCQKRSLLTAYCFPKRIPAATAFATVGFSLDDAEIDPELAKAYRGTVLLPFKPGKHRRVAVKILGDRGLESLKVVEVIWWAETGPSYLT